MTKTVSVEAIERIIDDLETKIEKLKSDDHYVEFTRDEKACIEIGLIYSKERLRELLE